MGGSWFVAIPVDGAFLARLAPAPQNFRILHAEEAHVTIAFLGACGEAAALRAWAALTATLLPQRFPWSLGEVVPLGPAGAFSALSALLDEGRPEAEALISTLRDGLHDAAGVPREAREPKAHVTIARPARRADDADRVAALAWARALPLATIRGTADRLALYTRADGDPSRRYLIAAEAPLRG